MAVKHPRRRHRLRAGHPVLPGAYRQGVHLVLQEEVVDEKIAAYLKENHITTRPYDAIYDYVKEIPADACVLMNGNTVNYRITSSLKKEIRIVDQPNPTEIMKAVKNPVEVENIRKGTCEGRCGIHQIHVLAEDQYRQDSDDGDLRIGLPGGAQKRAG